jgi:hypothetical protein
VIVALVPLAAFPVEVASDPVLIALQVAVAVSTLLAVVVALFGSDFRERRKRPKLTIGTEYDWEASLIHLTLTNDPGKDPAKQVEIVVVERLNPAPFAPPNPSMSKLIRRPIERPLGWHHGIDVSATGSVPAGVKRRCPLIRYEVDETPESPQPTLYDSFQYAGSAISLMVLPKPVELGDMWPSGAQWTEEPARLRVVIAADNMPSRVFDLFVIFLPRHTSTYEKRIEAHISVDPKEVPRQPAVPHRLRWWRRRQRIAYPFRRGTPRPLPNQSGIARFRERRRTEGPPRRDQSAIQRALERRRRWR